MVLLFSVPKIQTTLYFLLSLMLSIHPLVAGAAVGSDGFYTSPSVYEVTDSTDGLSHGTGLLVSSAWNSIPAVDSDINTWISAFNYPFADSADRTSVDHPSITIPVGLFKEFNIVAPAGDRPTGDVSGENFPVYINRILRNDASADELTIYFSTFNVESPSIVPVEFASLVISRDDTQDTILQIVPEAHLFPTVSTNADFHQGFGKGHVVLSSLWSGSTSVVDDFFDSFLTIIDAVADATFTEESGRVSSFGVSRVPQFTPTSGQSEALRGSTASTSPPSSTNRFVTEDDQGLGTQVDFSVETSLPADKRTNADIERFGYTGSLGHRVVKLVVDSSGDSHNYTDDILPRLVVLFGRNPVFGDFWWDGTRLKFFNGDTWVG